MVGVRGGGDEGGGSSKSQADHVGGNCDGVDLNGDLGTRRDGVADSTQVAAVVVGVEVTAVVAAATPKTA